MKQKISGYYRDECNKIAPIYDPLIKVITSIFGGEDRFRKKIVNLADPHSGDKILDVCCGTGTLTVMLAQKVNITGEIIGIDLAPKMLAIAQKKTNSSNISFIKANAENLPYPDDSFDLVTVSYGLHEMSRSGRHNTMAEIKRVLSPAGKFVIAELHQPENNFLKLMFKLFMRLEDETARDLMRNGLVNEVESVGFKIMHSQTIFRGFTQLVAARKIVYLK